MQKDNSTANLNILDLLTRAAVFRTLAYGFAYPVAGFEEKMQARFLLIEMPLRIQCNSPPMDTALQMAYSAWENVDHAVLKNEYLRLFVDNSSIDLYETAYGDGASEMGCPSELADIRDFYHAFGFEVASQGLDFSDNLLAELEFYSLLLVKQSYAYTHGWTAQAEITEQAAKLFLERHLGRWVGTIVKSIRAQNALSPYCEHSKALAICVDLECQRLGAYPVPLQAHSQNDMRSLENFSDSRVAVFQRISH